MKNTEVELADTYHWFIFAGTEPAVLIKQETNDMETLKSNCRLYAKQHKAAIWAVAVSQVTGILAWPCPPGRATSEQVPAHSPLAHSTKEPG